MAAPKAPKPDQIRKLEGPFCWIDHRFKWFWEELSREELLLYFFLVTTGNADGCSWYSSRKICKVLKIGPATLIRARETLEQRRLICSSTDELSNRTIYQVLPLPIEENVRIQIPIKPTVQKKPAEPKYRTEDSAAPAQVEQHSMNMMNLERIQDFLKKV